MSNFWQGDRVLLRQTEPGDWERHHRWDMDTEMMGDLWKVPTPKSKEASKKSALEMSTAAAKDDRYHLEIELIDTQEHIGSIGTNNVDVRNGTFRYGIGIDRGYRQHGYASEAITLLLKYFFEELRYQKCNAEVASWNVSSIKLHEGLGFQKEAQIRRTTYTKGQYFDTLIFGLTDDEFQNEHGR